MSKQFFDVAIIGAGPGGISAAARASQQSMSHALLESSGKHANTIQQFQKGKHVMAEPNQLPLRSDIEFEAGERESILKNWEHSINNTDINILYQAEVISIDGNINNFRITLKSGDFISAKNIVLALGVQGNARKLNVPGEDYSFVQNTLESADAYQQETIVIVGAGDSAIENAISLSHHNRVILINRRNDFSRAKEANMNRILKAIDTKQIECFYESAIIEVNQNTAEQKFPGQIVLKTPDNVISLECHRVITRLGTVPPRKFVESVGIRYVSEQPDALPEISLHYESNVPGIYLIGALAGYPLIKQAMNQGYEAIEHILGNPIKPSDHSILQEKLEILACGEDVENALTQMTQNLQLFRDINPLNLRELIMSSDIIAPEPGDEIFAQGCYSSNFYNILCGEVRVHTDSGDVFTLKQGLFFGESSLISGRPRQTTVISGENCILLVTPPRAMKKLIRMEKSVNDRINKASIIRSLTRLMPHTPEDVIRNVAKQTKIHHFAANEIVFREGDPSGHLYLVRRGSITLSKKTGAGEVIVAYCAVGSFIGLIGLSKNSNRMVAAQATVTTEALSIDYASFNELLLNNPRLRAKVQQETQYQLAQYPSMQAEPKRGETLSFLMDHGIGEATNILIIDESLCVGCDNCETACASTHHGISRLNRKAGPSFESLHIPISCRHCEHPHCMKDCPPDAIHRLESGEVFIDNDTCIGCGNCVENCPYDAIKMDEIKQNVSLFARLLGKRPQVTYKTAVKCDMCKDVKSGPSCVNACPTGAAIRIHADQVVTLVNKRVTSLS